MSFRHSVPSARCVRGAAQHTFTRHEVHAPGRCGCMVAWHAVHGNPPLRSGWSSGRAAASSSEGCGACSAAAALAGSAQAASSMP